ncbi:MULTISPECIES: hypothetical protein [Sphingomonas]|uniref:hypothetical protein n=1 Tax=Sphingomonas TaxID=13687 RepID=UPI001AEF1A6B|nr:MULTISPECIES: hypothetical protein [Sphingomonas]
MEMTTTMARTPTRLAVSMHEAGHAIVQLANGPAPWIDYISIEREGPDQLGIVQTAAMWQPWMIQAQASAEVIQQRRTLAHKDIIFYLAGPIAELRWRRHCRANIWFGGPEMAQRCLGESAPEERSDLGRVRARLTWAHPGREAKAFNDAWLEAEEAVARFWREIRQLGRLLAAKGRIEDEALLEIWREMSEARRQRTKAVPTSALAIGVPFGI